MDKNIKNKEKRDIKLKNGNFHTQIPIQFQEFLKIELDKFQIWLQSNNPRNLQLDKSDKNMFEEYLIEVIINENDLNEIILTPCIYRTTLSIPT
ncbi:MAG: hypothetical protein PSX81_09450 [bacterium]|nr:hypothetical protein [bacterium]